MKALRRLLAEAEALGSLLLAATVIGSGIMAARLAGGNAAIALFGLPLMQSSTLIRSRIRQLPSLDR